MVNKNIYKDTQIRSSETIAEELSRLREYSEQNNINKVNNCVDFLLRNPEFWILCYESIKRRFHGFHVFIGTCSLFVSLVRIVFNHFTNTHHFGFESAAWYWHFVDVVWLFLFITVYWWGGIQYH
jgi:hypothetical protein